MTIDFTPKPAIEPEVTPQTMEIGSPDWVVSTWQRLYYTLPTPGLKKRVLEAEEWYNGQDW